MPAKKKRGAKTIRRVKKVNKILRKTKAISKSLRVLRTLVPAKHKGKVSKALLISSQLGYGLKLAGQGKRKRRVGRPCKRT